MFTTNFMAVLKPTLFNLHIQFYYNYVLFIKTPKMSSYTHSPINPIHR